MALPQIIPDIPSFSYFFISITSSMVDTPPDAITGIETFSAISLVDEMFGPYIMPSLSISVNIMAHAPLDSA